MLEEKQILISNIETLNKSEFPKFKCSKQLCLGFRYSNFEFAFIMPQFFINQALQSKTKVKITGKDAHHIARVLRLKRGDWLHLSDGNGNSFEAEVISANSKVAEVMVKARLQRKLSQQPPALAFAIIKHDRTEYIIQKAVELGCTNLTPFYSERTIPKYYFPSPSPSPTRGEGKNTFEKKMVRWQKIAEAAAKQSGLPCMPQVSLPISFEKLCKSFSAYKKTIMFWEGEEENELKSLVLSLKSPVLLIIGPEGGFSAKEIELAKKCGAVTVSLGQQILRVETAALAALAIVQYELGNMSL